MGFGTSCPELVASVTATLRGASGVAAGNVIGSNIFNIGVIVGITALIHPIRVRLRAVRRDLILALVAACVPGVALLFDATLPRAVGAGLLGILGAYLVVAYRTGRGGAVEQNQLAQAEMVDTIERPGFTVRWAESAVANTLSVAVGLGLLIGGSRFFVGSAVELARAVGLSEFVIGLSIVSAGTSLPELVTSIVAGSRRNPDIAVGNIIGSNIFNVFGILGVNSVLRPQTLRAWRYASCFARSTVSSRPGSPIW